MFDRIFQNHIGRNVEVYFDTMIIKSTNDMAFLRDVEETLKMLEKTQMELNPTKYIFGQKKDNSYVITSP